MPRAARLRRRLLRRLLSLPALALLVVLLAASAGASLALLQHRVEQRAQAQAVDAARVIADLVVFRNVAPIDYQSSLPLPADVVSDIADDVAMLQGSGRAEGLEVWRLDGGPLFLDGSHPGAELHLPARERALVEAGRPFVLESAGERTRPTTDVFLPRRLPGGGVVGVVEVLLPQQQLSGQIDAATRSFLAVAGALLVALVVGMLALRRRLHRREHQARHDRMTGLLNRGALSEDALDVLAPSSPGLGAALVVIDLDGFRSVNDTLGHLAGDALLLQVAGVLREAAGTGSLVAALGGDAFAVLAPYAVGVDPVRLAADIVHRVDAAAYEVDGVALAVTASAGVALAPEHGTTLEELLQHGDVAMYQAKRAHSGTALYDPRSDHHDVSQLAVLVELRRAVEVGELVLHYQPQVRAGDGAVVGVEALVRWQHPTRGLLPPGDFVELAERTPLIHPLTEWVLRAAVQQAQRWHRAGTPLRVAVNASPRSLLDGDLPALVASVLSEAGVPASVLELEITETAVLTDPVRAADVLRELVDMGVKLSIDDFGAGYTSLGLLKQLPVQALKIDRALVSGIGERPEDEAITAAVVEMGHRLGMTVLAEGVETQEVLDQLRWMACDEAQGYLLSRPLPVDALERWLEGRRVVPPHGTRTPSTTGAALPARA